MKFCGHRWLENTKVISRIIDIFPYLQKYFQWLLTEKKIPKKDECFKFLKVYLADPITLAILQFALSVGELLELFLTLFQAEQPLVFFMYENLKDLILSLVTRFVRTEVIKHTLSQIVKLNFRDDSKILPSASIDVGFAANSILKKLNTRQSTKVCQFRKNAKTFHIELMTKLAEKALIKYPFTLFLSSLSPMQIIAVSNKSLKKRFGKILKNLLDASWISGKVADCAKVQYIKLLGNNKVMEQIRKYDVNKNRADKFYMNIFSDVLPLLN